MNSREGQKRIDAAKWSRENWSHTAVVVSASAAIVPGGRREPIKPVLCRYNAKGDCRFGIRSGATLLMRQVNFGLPQGRCLPRIRMHFGSRVPACSAVEFCSAKDFIEREAAA